MLEQAVAKGEKSWPELLKSFAWFPRVLFDVGPAKQDARWRWIKSFEPENHAEPVPGHDHGQNKKVTFFYRAHFGRNTNKRKSGFLNAPKCKGVA